MTASTRDISLTIVSNGEPAYYSGVRNIGNIIWDPQLGIFSGNKPVASRALDFTAETGWKEYIESRDAFLTLPKYGFVTIDFDAKTVVDKNIYGYSNRIPTSWLEKALEDALKDQPSSLFSAVSLVDHLEHHRIILADTNDLRIGYRLTSMTIEDALKEVRLNRTPHIYQAVLLLPDDWRHRMEERN